MTTPTHTADSRPQWYARKGSMGQGLIICERTGATIAVAYDAEDAPLIAAAPELLAMLQRVLHPMASDDDIDEARALLDRLNREGIK